MRLIGTVPRRDLAERFQDFLIAKGVNCSLDDDGEGAAVWVHDDDQVATARQELQAFLNDPDSEKYGAARAQAMERLKAEAAQRKAARARTVNLRDRWRPVTAADCPISVAVLVMCVFVFADMYLMNDQRNIFSLLTISTDGTWREVLGGEVWRLFSPAIMHGGPLHILFNLLWWWNLGRLIEVRKGSFVLLLMTLTIAGFSNTLQFWGSGPRFQGLSGVVFGLFGYVWTKGKLDPADGIGIDDQSAMWMMVWLVICMTGAVGDIANYAHFGGLFAGMLLALASVGARRARLW